jgi:hypothetical protein
VVVDIVDLSTTSVDVDIVDELKRVELVKRGVLVFLEVLMLVETSVGILAVSVVVVNIEFVVFCEASAGVVFVV